MTFFESARPTSQRSDPQDPFSSIYRDRRRGRAIAASLVVGVIVAIVGVVVLVVGPAQVATTARQILAGEAPRPAPELIAIADRSFLTEEGRALLYDARPRLVDRDEIAHACPVSGGEVSTLGCYSPLSGIVVYRPDDVRLADTMVTVLMHEMLHAAYQELGTGEILDVHDMLHAAITQIPADDLVHLLIESSMGGHEASRETEMFAYLGSQVYPDGGLAPELEAVYARFISDRAHLVGVYRNAEAVVQSVVAESQLAVDQLVAEETANANNRAQWEADRVAHDQARQVYNQEADEYNAIPQSERPGWSATWTTSDGTTVTRPLGESLSTRLAELEAYRAELDSRAVALAEAEAAVAARRPQVAAQLTDMEALLEAAYPGQTFD